METGPMTQSTDDTATESAIGNGKVSAIGAGTESAIGTADESVMSPSAESDLDSQEEDYVFRFSLQTRSPHPSPDRVLETFYREQLQDLLRIVFFSRDGRTLLPNEFGFLNQPDVRFPIQHD